MAIASRKARRICNCDSALGIVTPWGQDSRSEALFYSINALYWIKNIKTALSCQIYHKKDTFGGLCRIICQIHVFLYIFGKV